MPPTREPAMQSIIGPFTAEVPDEALEVLRSRLALSRWPATLADAGWSFGTEAGFLEEVCTYWWEQFDWRTAEARLNGFPQFRTELDGLGIHFIHARSSASDAVPLLLMNGWPSSIFEYLTIIPMLTGAGFDVIAPALPGYGFSDQPKEKGISARVIASLYVRLLSALGYDRFVAHGSDIGAGVLEHLRFRFPLRLIGAHFSNVYWAYPRPENARANELAYFSAADSWMANEGAYGALQRTKPQTLAYALNDSPIGLAAWILEKFHAWCDGDPLRVIGIDDLCANLTLYWVTKTIGSSVRLYAESARDPLGMMTERERGSVPTAVIRFPGDILPAPREWGERWLNLVQWTEAPHGGHFPAWEEPEILADDLAQFKERLAREGAYAPQGEARR